MPSPVFVAITSLTQAHAQDLAVRVNVPFAFNSGSAQLAAGTYTIEMQSPDIVALSNYAKRSTRLATIESRTNSGSATCACQSLTFRKHGNTYFLAEYSTGGTTIKRSNQAKSAAWLAKKP